MSRGDGRTSDQIAEDVEARLIAQTAQVVEIKQSLETTYARLRAADAILADMPRRIRRSQLVAAAISSVVTILIMMGVHWLMPA